MTTRLLQKRQLLAILSFTIFASVGAANPEICEDVPEFLNELKSEIPAGFDALPKMMMVAREAEIFIASKTTPYRFHGRQSFIPSKDRKLRNKVVCATAIELKRESAVFQLPTVIDLAKNKSLGIWQIQVESESKKFKIWTQRSRLLSSQRSASEFLVGFGGNFKLYQVGHDQYELQQIRETDKFSEILSVTYDAVEY